MTLDIIAFIASILFGILLYWRESKGNGLYRFLNKLMNSKELQMKPEDRTGFVHQQKFLLRLVFITFLFLAIILIVRFLIPIDTGTISMFASGVVGTLLGTYIAAIVLKTSKIIDEKSGVISDIVDKGKEFVEDLTNDKESTKEKEEPKEEAPKTEEKSARERLKDKGLL